MEPNGTAESSTETENWKKFPFEVKRIDENVEKNVSKLFSGKEMSFASKIKC